MTSTEQHSGGKCLPSHQRTKAAHLLEYNLAVEHACVLWIVLITAGDNPLRENLRRSAVRPEGACPEPEGSETLPRLGTARPATAEWAMVVPLPLLPFPHANRPMRNLGQPGLGRPSPNAACPTMGVSVPMWGTRKGEPSARAHAQTHPSLAEDCPEGTGSTRGDILR